MLVGYGSRRNHFPGSLRQDAGGYVSNAAVMKQLIYLEITKSDILQSVMHRISPLILHT